MARFLARIRLPIQYAGLVLVVVVVVWVLLRALRAVPQGPDSRVVFTGLGLVVLGFLLTLAGPAVKGEPLVLASPVQGRWQAVNSPTTKVPSHGTHGYGPSYAVDLVYAPEGVEKPEFGKAGGAFLRPEKFPAFGQPILAPADAVVVRAADGARDHLSRSSWLAYAYLFVEGLFRELRGPKGVVGNHLVLRLEDGSHFLLAHLRKGSLRVGVGDRVVAGQQLAECGNSGNTTEPHVHCQRQDLASTFVAAGLPWTIESGGIPANEDYLSGSAGPTTPALPSSD